MDSPSPSPSPQRGPKVLLGVTGSVASIKTAELVGALLSETCQVKVVLTDKAQYFARPSLWSIPFARRHEDKNEHNHEDEDEDEQHIDHSSTALHSRDADVDASSPAASREYECEHKHHYETPQSYDPSASAHFPVDVYIDEDEWPASLWTRKDSVLHIELRKWADLLLIAPLSAHTLASIAHGLCPNLLLSVARAWDYTRSPLIVAPAMNTHMWSHPLTAQQLSTLQCFGPHVHVINPIVKRLACGDIGQGGMEEPRLIVQSVKQIWQAHVSDSIVL